MISAKPILVTGAAGLIGNKVRQILDERGDRVIAVDRQTGSDTFGQVIACDLGDVHRVRAHTRRYFWRHPLRRSFRPNGGAGQSVFDGAGQHRGYRQCARGRTCS